MPFGVSSGTPNVIIHAKFRVDRLRGFWAAGPPKVPFPILIGTTQQSCTAVQTVIFTVNNAQVLWWAYGLDGGDGDDLYIYVCLLDQNVQHGQNLETAGADNAAGVAR